jgi:hypothetical protein
MSRQQLNLEFPALSEAQQFLNVESWGTFSVLLKNKIGNNSQSSHRLCTLPKVISMCVADSFSDYWISQASFKKFNRRKVNLNAISLLFVDIDYYNDLKLAHLTPEQVLQKHLIPHCERIGIPPPSIAIDSGRGLQLKWFHEAIPAQALPRWDAVMNYLVKSFECLGGDNNAKDASRVLRIVQTINQKNNQPVRIIHTSGGWDDPDRYVFDELCNKILPFTQDQVREFRLNTKSRDGRERAAEVLRLPAARLSLSNLNWSRLCDIQKIVELRGGDVGDGLREPTAFWLCNHYALRYYGSGISDKHVWHEFNQLCRLVAPHWSRQQVTSKTSHLLDLMRRSASGETVTFNNKSCVPLYTPTNDYLINALQITSDEQQSLSTIISKSEKHRRRLKKQTENRRKKGIIGRAEYEAKAADLAVKVKALKVQGFKQREIAEKLGITQPRVSQLLKI